jgi:hypothetical protein
MGSHLHVKNGKQSNQMTMKYDGSPAVVFGKHPDTGKFFVATKSAFNKNPKINYSDADIDKNHGHAPGLAEKLKDALHHLPKVAPKEGIYQGDLMFSGNDVQKNKDGSASFTPNTITYTAKGDAAKKIAKAKLGMVVHTEYDPKTMKSGPITQSSANKFGHSPDVYHHTANLDTSQVHYTDKAQKDFIKHMAAAKAIHDKHGDEMYEAVKPHAGEAGQMSTYINQTVRDGTKPTAEGLKDHIAGKYEKMISKLKTEKSQNAKLDELKQHLTHIKKNQDHYDNIFKLHQHLQAAKNGLVNTLESNEGEYAHAINGVASKPEGYVYSHTHNGKTEPTKLVNRAEFARQNLLKSRGPAKEETEKHHTLAFGRMNPPTAGHEEVVKKLKETAKEVGGDHTLVLSGSHATKDGKNPLSPERKLYHAKNAFPGTNIKIADKDHPTILNQASELHKQGVTNLHFVGGSDRKPMYELLKKYNGVEGKHGFYNFKSIDFHSSGERDENAKGVSGVSGTKLRKMASSGDKEGFHAALSSQMKPKHKEELYNDLRKAMSIKEHIEKVSGGYMVKSEHGDKNLGKSPTLAGAKKRLRQIEYFKYLKK